MGSVIRNTAIPLLAVLLGCAPARVDPSGTTASDSVVAAVRAAVDRTNANYAASFLRGDAAGLASGYSDDAVVMRSGRSDLVGRANIEADFAKGFAATTNTILTFQAGTQTLDVAGDHAWEYGTGTMTVRPKATPNAAPTTTHFKYLTFWRREPDGAWRVVRDLGVVDSPPTQ